MEEQYIKEEIDILKSVSEDILVLPDVAVAFFEKSPDAGIVTDRNGIILFVNNQAEFMFGYHRSELKGNKIEILLPDNKKDIHEKHRSNFVDDPHLRTMGQGLELNAKTKTGVEIPVEINLSPVMVHKIGLVIIAVIRRKK